MVMHSQRYSGPAFRFVFFGTSFFATEILNALEQYGLSPSLIVATPDTPQGRKLILTPLRPKSGQRVEESKSSNPRHSKMAWLLNDSPKKMPIYFWSRRTVKSSPSDF